MDRIMRSTALASQKELGKHRTERGQRGGRFERRHAVVLIVGILGGIAAEVAWLEGDSEATVPRALAQLGVAWTWLGCGVFIWARRPGNAIGPLMIAWPIAAIYLSNLGSLDSPVAFTSAALTVGLAPVTFGHLALAFPNGRLPGPAERAWSAAAYVWVLAWSTSYMLFYKPATHGCAGCPESLIAVAGERGVLDALHLADQVVVAMLFAAWLALLVRRVVSSSPPARRTFVPIIFAAFAFALFMVLNAALGTGGGFGRGELVAGEAPTLNLPMGRPEGGPMWWAYTAWTFAVPLALLFELLRARFGRAVIADLVVEVQEAPADRLQQALARALGDPSLRLLFPRGDGDGYVDIEGHPASASAGGGMAVTSLESNGARAVLVVHDPALLEEPGLLEAAGAAARLSLQNARLQAVLRAQLAEVRSSRARIAMATDAERRRLERDLHDGAQQRLLGAALSLQLARGKADGMGAELSDALRESEAALEAAVAELRELGHGIRPSVLTDHGLGPALRALARRCPTTVEVAAVPTRRFAGHIEAAVYFAASEALQNAAKHSGAQVVWLRAAVTKRRLVLEVADDGVGGADPAGEGLRGLQDRVASVGGTLRLDSPRGRGTRVRAEIPCG